jgi:hypothetical protein
MYQENRVVVAGKLVEISGKEGIVETEKNKYRFLFTNQYQELLEKLKDQTLDNLYVVVHGIVANMPEYDYIFPYNISVSKFFQAYAENAIIEGTVADQYEHENRYRLFVRSSRNGKISKLFLTVFKNTYNNLNLTGESILATGRLSVSKGRISLVADKIFVFVEKNGNKDNISMFNTKLKNYENKLSTKGSDNPLEFEDEEFAF